MNEAREVRNYTAYKIKRISETGDGPMKAELANLRRGIGHSPGELPELWGIFLRDMPQELLSESGAPSRAEWAVYTALTLYALHQQGSDPKKDSMNREGQTLGRALRLLVAPNDEDAEKRVLRRFNQAVTASDMKETSYHLRGLIQLLRAENIKLDYPSLAFDLFWYQFPEQTANVRLKWGQDFYRIEKKPDEISGETQKQEGTGK